MLLCFEIYHDLSKYPKVYAFPISELTNEMGIGLTKIFGAKFTKNMSQGNLSRDIDGCKERNH